MQTENLTDQSPQPTAGPVETSSPPARTSLLPDARGHLIFWPVAIGGLALDLWSKQAVFEMLSSRHEYSYPVIHGFMNLVTAENDGAAFGMASGKLLMLIVVAAVALVVILGLFLRSGATNRVAQLSMALFAAGISGNLYDRLFNNGHVRDFIDLYYGSYHWYTFNIADSLLCTAVAILLISSFMPEKPRQTQTPQHK